MWQRCIRVSALINHGGAESLQWQGGERSREFSSFSLEMPLSKPQQLKNQINCRERSSFRSDLMEGWIAIGGKPIARNWLKRQLGIDQERWLLVIDRGAKIRSFRLGSQVVAVAFVREQDQRCRESFCQRTRSMMLYCRENRCRRWNL